MESQTNERVYADLVSGLLGVRVDPATTRFDAELDTAVEAGQVSAEVAQELRFWQRASLHALSDHIRTVVPVALGALEASRREAEAYLDELLDRVASAEEARQESADVPADAPRDDEPDDSRQAPVQLVPVLPQNPAAEQETVVVLPPPINLEGQRSRLIVAGLVSTTSADIRDEHRRA